MQGFEFRCWCLCCRCCLFWSMSIPDQCGHAVFKLLKYFKNSNIYTNKINKKRKNGYKCHELFNWYCISIIKMFCLVEYWCNVYDFMNLTYYACLFIIKTSTNLNTKTYCLRKTPKPFLDCSRFSSLDLGAWNLDLGPRSLRMRNERCERKKRSENRKKNQNSKMMKSCN